VDGIENLAARLPRIAMPAGRPVRLEAGAIAALDTSGAWLLQRLRLQLEAAGNPVEVQDLQAHHADLYQRVRELGTTEPPREPRLGPWPVPAGARCAGWRSCTPSCPSSAPS
jgi:hypothetical protein